MFYSFHPFLMSLMFFNLIMSLMLFLIFKKFILLFKMMIYITLILLYFWFIDLLIESVSGFLNILMKDFMKYGFMLFVFSEFMFFFSIFWFFFDMSFSTGLENYDIWTPLGLVLINPFTMPLMNTFILLGSGFSITIFYMNLINNKKDFLSFFITLILALMFLLIQKQEYNEMIFTMKDSIFSSIFFFSTGFHGLHVFMGLLFLFVNFIRLMKLDFFKNNIMSLEFSIIYWHFVDVVWLFLFVFIYWWTY